MPAPDDPVEAMERRVEAVARAMVSNEFGDPDEIVDTRWSDESVHRPWREAVEQGPRWHNKRFDARCQLRIIDADRAARGECAPWPVPPPLYATRKPRKGD